MLKLKHLSAAKMAFRKRFGKRRRLGNDPSHGLTKHAMLASIFGGYLSIPLSIIIFLITYTTSSKVEGMTDLLSKQESLNRQLVQQSNQQRTQIRNQETEVFKLSVIARNQDEEVRNLLRILDGVEEQNGLTENQFNDLQREAGINSTVDVQKIVNFCWLIHTRMTKIVERLNRQDDEETLNDGDQEEDHYSMDPATRLDSTISFIKSQITLIIDDAHTQLLTNKYLISDNQLRKECKLYILLLKRFQKDMEMSLRIRMEERQFQVDVTFLIDNTIAPPPHGPIHHIIEPGDAIKQAYADLKKMEFMLCRDILNELKRTGMKDPEFESILDDYADDDEYFDNLGIKKE